jgi:hypothetical protein
LTTNYVRRQRMFLLVPSAHAVGCQEEIPPGKYQFMLRNLIDTYLRPEFGKSTANVPTTMSAKLFMEPETDEVRWSIHVLQSL